MLAREGTAHRSSEQSNTLSRIKTILFIIGVYTATSHIYREATDRWLNLNLVCTVTGWTCRDQSDLAQAWNSGTIVLQTSERVMKMARIVGVRSSPTVNASDLAWVSLPGNLERMALQVGDYIAHYHRAPTGEDMDATAQRRWDEFASQCWSWRYNLTQVARDAYSVQLGIRTVASKGLTVLQRLGEAWFEDSSTASPSDSREQLLLELQSMRRHIIVLSENVRRTEGRMLEQEQAGSILITTAIGRVQMTELEIANRAQTWSWQTTLLVYGVATVIGGATSAVVPVSAPVVVAGIAHFVNSRKNEQYKTQLRNQNVLYTQAGAVLTDARTVLMQMDKELLEFAGDLNRCEEAVMVAIGRVDVTTKDNRTRTSVRAALSAAIKELESLHAHSQRAVSAYTGQTKSQQPILALPDGR